MKQPLVSVVVPIYNVEAYLQECFDSIARQSYKKLEIILVDDGATDGSGKLADSLAMTDKRATVLHKKNGGLSDARNAGMKHAKGEFITFIDSDDTVSEEFIERLVEAALTNDADIVQCNNSRKIKDMGNGTSSLKVLDGKQAFTELMKYKTISPTAWGKLYKTALFTEHAIEFPVGRLHEDTAVLYKLIYFARTIVCVDQILYYYRMNSNSIMTASYTKRHYESVTLYHEELDAFIGENAIGVKTTLLHRHKALRLLSVLNKLAVRETEASAAYVTFRKKYMYYALRSNDVVCVFGVFPAKVPVVFRATKKAIPTIRKVLGKT